MAIELADAIKIAGIIAKAPEERLPLIMAVLEKADFTVDGLEEIEEWRSYKGQGTQTAIIDVEKLREDLIAAFPPNENTPADAATSVLPKDYNDYCKKHKIRPRIASRALADKGYIKVIEEGDKRSFSQPMRVGGKLQRFIIIY